MDILPPFREHNATESIRVYVGNQMTDYQNDGLSIDRFG